QIVVAGKAHPADEGGKGLIQQMVQFTDSPDVRRRIVFLPDDDMDMAHALVQGCDVWLNNPLRPLEACGTSGMKAALNGGVNPALPGGWGGDEVSAGDRRGTPPAAGGARVRRGRPAGPSGRRTASTTPAGTTSRQPVSTTWWRPRWRRASTTG